MASAAIKSLKDYEDRLIGLDPNLFCGNIVWFSVAGDADYSSGKRAITPVSVNRDWLVDQFKELGMDEGLIPAKISPGNAFRQVSTTVKREYPTGRKGVTATLMVREVTHDDTQIVRHIVKELRDSLGQKLSYNGHMATLRFMKGTKNVTPAIHSVILGAGSGGGPDPELWAQLMGDTDDEMKDLLDVDYQTDVPQLQSMIAQIKADYVDACANLQSQAIRGIIRRYLESLNAISVKRAGGVYFVHNTRQDAIDALQTLVSRIAQGCSCHVLPLLDTREQREMLTDAFQDEVEDDVRLLLQTLAEVSKNGVKIKSTKFAELQTQYQHIVGRAHEYSELLGLAQDRAGAALELALDSLMSLEDRVIMG